MSTPQIRYSPQDGQALFLPVGSILLERGDTPGRLELAEPLILPSGRKLTTGDLRPGDWWASTWNDYSTSPSGEGWSKIRWTVGIVDPRGEFEALGRWLGAPLACLTFYPVPASLRAQLEPWASRPLLCLLLLSCP